ncbi:MAG: GNAT family N-acetyltransferase [Thermoproteota archaeon]
MQIRFEVGCNIEEFKKYYMEARGSLNETEEYIILQDPTHLIVWKDDDNILGHAIWHESYIEEHREGVPRDERDKELLMKLLGEKRKFAELHELLKVEHRGKGFGKKFFEFFENFIHERGYDTIVYYTNDLQP